MQFFKQKLSRRGAFELLRDAFDWVSVSSDHQVTVTRENGARVDCAPGAVHEVVKSARDGAGLEPIEIDWRGARCFVACNRSARS